MPLAGLQRQVPHTFVFRGVRHPTCFVFVRLKDPGDLLYLLKESARRLKVLFFRAWTRRKDHGRSAIGDGLYPHAACGARNARYLYAWGDTRVIGGEHQANTWQGSFPTHNTVADGYRYTSPVGAFGETDLGLQDMGGNVWEWTDIWFRPYSERSASFTPTRKSERVQRGGSFQCDECLGFRVYTRSHSTSETSLFHVGFRCVADVAR